MLQNPYAKGISIPNPKVPLSVDIPNGVQPGRKIYVNGTCAAKSEAFRVDLLTPQNFIALHINPRFKQNQIVRNSDRGGWGTEEKDGVFPFKNNQPFEMIITVHNDDFKVTVDGARVFDYKHRVPINEITRLNVSGDVVLKSVSFSVEDVARTQASDLPTPSAIAILGGSQVGKIIQVVGSVLDKAEMFSINMQVGPQLHSKDISLHFNPRFKDSIVVRNSLKNDVWGTEDRTGTTFPFKRGATFEILIFCDVSEWKVSVNGKHFISYPHQFPIKAIDHVKFTGDVKITNVRQFN